MRSIRPIPKKMLIHSIQYEEYIGDERWGDKWADPVTINHVLVQPATSLSRGSNSEDVVAQHVLYIDRKHSSKFPHMTEKSKVTFEGDTWEVHKVNPYYAFGSIPHHYENELV